MKKLSNSYPVQFLLATTLLLVFAMTIAYAKTKATKEFSDTVSAEPYTNVEVETKNGSIFVTGYEGEEIIVDAEISVTGSKKDICQDLLQNVEINLDKRGRTLKIGVDHKKRRKYNISATFELKIPHRMSLDAGTVNGSIEVADLVGGVDVSTVNGQIICEKISGGIDAGTINGSLHLTDVSGEIDAGSVNGSITCTAYNDAPSGIDLGTINGNITLELGSEPNARVEASAMNGRVEIEGVSGLEFPKRIKSWEGTLGAGDNYYDLGTVNGSVLIQVKKK